MMVADMYGIMMTGMGLLTLLPLTVLSSCPPGEYTDTVTGVCSSCREICHPKYETQPQCLNTPECVDFLRLVFSEFLRKFYQDENEAVTGTPTGQDVTCMTPASPAVDFPLALGLSIGICFVAIMITAYAAFKFGKYMERRNLDQHKSYIAQAQDESDGRLLPSGSTSASTSASTSHSSGLNIGDLGNNSQGRPSTGGNIYRGSPRPQGNAAGLSRGRDLSLRPDIHSPA